VREIVGGELALLVALWIAGRVTTLAPAVPAWLAALADASVWLATFALLAPMLIGTHARKFAVVLPLVLALPAVDAWFHFAAAAGHVGDPAGGDPASARHALDAAVAVIAVLFSLVGGFMTPVFTGNAMREAGQPHEVVRPRLVERLAHASAVAFLVVVALGLTGTVAALAGCIAGLVHGLRLAGWRGWRVRRAPLVTGMHVAYAWLVLAFLLFAAAHAGAPLSPRAWLHALTIGAVGTMMLALMPRVALRHTGRAVRPHPGVLWAMAAMVVAALLRLAADSAWGDTALAGSGLAWLFAFSAYLACHGAMLLRRSLPRTAPVTRPPDE
jgi:uncharacterized protein involved in response to NO